MRPSSDPSYRPPLWLRNGHINTITGGSLRKPARPAYHLERLDTPDGDFLDLAWVRAGHSRVAVLLHGLEGSAERPYIRGMVHALSASGWDVLAWSFRGCSGEPNRLLRSYHSGETEDLATVLKRVSGYDQVALVGFSLGGNVTLKYLGERGQEAGVDAAVAFSVPCDLASSAEELARPGNRPYMLRFMRSLRAKMEEKARMHPGEISTEGLATMRTFAEFDEAYTAPIHGFSGAQDYWTRCSSRGFLGGIRVPTLLVNALDDPFLPAACYPVEEANANRWLTLEMPRYGGHVGFVARGPYWSELRASAFLEEALGSQVRAGAASATARSSPPLP